MARAKIILGPVRCQGCRRFVAWSGGAWKDIVPERQRTYFEKHVKGIHKCPAVIHSERRRYVDNHLAAQHRQHNH